MAVQYKINTKLTSAKPASHAGINLDKRVLMRAIRRQAPILVESAIALRGHTIIAENGYVVKVKADGTRENISKLKSIKRPSKIVLD